MNWNMHTCTLDDYKTKKIGLQKEKNLMDIDDVSFYEHKK